MMPGERVDIGRNVVRMVDQQHLEVIARAPLEYYSYVRPGQELSVRTGHVDGHWHGQNSGGGWLREHTSV